MHLVVYYELYTYNLCNFKTRSIIIIELFDKKITIYSIDLQLHY